MDADIAAIRRGIHSRNEELKQLITQKKAHCREIIARNNSILELMNMELQTLRLQFVNEEIDATALTQTIGRNRQTACCITTKQDERVQTACSAKQFQEYWVVHSTEQFFKKKKELEQRQDQLGTCGWDCCHQCSGGLLVGVNQFCKTPQSLVIFLVSGLFLFYGLFMMLALPCLWVYRCCEFSCSLCYRRGSRTARVLQLYQKYCKQIEDVYLPLDRNSL